MSTGRAFAAGFALAFWPVLHLTVESGTNAGVSGPAGVAVMIAAAVLTSCWAGAVSAALFGGKK